MIHYIYAEDLDKFPTLRATMFNASVGLWELSEEAMTRMCNLSGIARDTARQWFNAGFSHDAHVYAA